MGKDRQAAAEDRSGPACRWPGAPSRPAWASRSTTRVTELRHPGQRGGDPGPGGPPEHRSQRGDHLRLPRHAPNTPVEHFPARGRCEAARLPGTVTGWKDLPQDVELHTGGLSPRTCSSWTGKGARTPPSRPKGRQEDRPARHQECSGYHKGGNRGRRSSCRCPVVAPALGPIAGRPIHGVCSVRRHKFLLRSTSADSEADGARRT
jgi:hypothetical protein